jgi:hypothetical protein
MLEDLGLTPNKAVEMLCRTPHGELQSYLQQGERIAQAEGEFFAHLIAWNQLKGTVRDAKLGLPLTALAFSSPEWHANALAHLLEQPPRDFARAVELRHPRVNRRLLRRLAIHYVRQRESHQRWLDSSIVSQRKAMKRLYAFWHIKPSAYAEQALFENKPLGQAAVLRRLPTATPREAGALIRQHGLPLLAVEAVLGPRLSEPDILQAVVEQMSPGQISARLPQLERLGVRSTPALRATLEQALSTLPVAGTARLSRTAPALKDAVLKEKVEAARERSLGKGSVDGDWLVLVDCSASMQRAIEFGAELAAWLVRNIRGQTTVVAFNSWPRGFRLAASATLADIKAKLPSTAGGGTAPGRALEWALAAKAPFDAIALVSDGWENSSATPYFGDVYRKAALDKPIYFFQLAGQRSPTDLDIAKSVPMEVYDCSRGDFYSMENIARTMRVNRFSLFDEILATPLLGLDLASLKAA